MARIFRMDQYEKSLIREAQQAQEPEKSDELSLDRFPDLVEEIKSMIEGSLGSEDKRVADDFIRAFNRSPEENVIEGMINDSDVYDFYLMWRSDIDDVLSAVNFFDEVPSEVKVYSLYDYIIQGTRRAVQEIVSMLEQ
jgi:hypothetical protein